MSEYKNIKYDTAISWQTSPQTTNFTAVSGQGYFIDTTSADITVTLPASPQVGDFVGILDYARTFGTNKCVISRNGSNIEGDTNDLKLATNGASATLVYGDATKGWAFVQQSDVGDLEAPVFVAATGGTETTCGDYKIHTFTSSGTFTVTCAGNAAGSDSVDYLVVAGGGGGGTSRAGGGGAGGYRESVPTPAAWTASPLADSGGSIPVSATSYPITVGAGGAGGNGPYQESGSQGVSSVFSTITSAGGGSGRSDQSPSPAPASIGGPGGSGGGGVNGQVGGTGNTPPVSPPQGNPGGSSTESAPNYGSGGGGGAGVAGTNGTSTVAGPGGNGVTSSINGSPVTRAGGGGGGGYTAPVPQPSGGSGGGGAGGRYSPTAIPGGNGTANTGGGGGGGASAPADGGGTGGSGTVIIRYKFQ